jgi:ParB family chromosome partitioning protein
MSQSKKSKRRKALGRGLSALIPKQGAETSGRTYFMCDIDLIDPAPEQPRKTFDEATLTELAESIDETGLIQPLVVRQKRDRFELIAGERRLRACKLAELEEVPVVAREVSDAQAFALALVENIQRQDLNPIEEAHAYERLIDEYEFSQAELASQVGKSRSSVTNALRLLNLSEAVRQHVLDGELTAGHARALVGLDDDVALALAERIIEEGLSVRATEALVREHRDDTPPEEKKARKSRYRDDAQTRALTDSLRQTLGTKVAVKDRGGKGRIEIHYDDYEILQSILDHIGVEL